ncbi:hypothetical protein J6590_014061 [Homalodisca vitripennis]|nr:hypothetical protein J6590_014061 [Homalodisca vitripennis]
MLRRWFHRYLKVCMNEREFLASEGSIWRCDPCSVNQRQRLRFDLQATEGKLTLEDVMKTISNLVKDQNQSIKDFNTSYEVLNEKLDENTRVLREQTEKVNEYLELIDFKTGKQMPKGKY